MEYVMTRTVWRGIEIEIRWCPEYMIYDDTTCVAHLEVKSISPNRAPLPITQTGYRSHFTPLADVEIYETPEAFVEAWLDDASRSREWLALEQSQRQLSLF